MRNNFALLYHPSFHGDCWLLAAAKECGFTTYYTDAMLTPEQLYVHFKPYKAFPLSGLADGSAHPPSRPAPDRGVAVLMENPLQE